MMPRHDFDEFYDLLYLQAQHDPDAVEASAYHDWMAGYGVSLKDAAAYALAGELFDSDESHEERIERIACMAGILTRTRYEQA